MVLAQAGDNQRRGGADDAAERVEEFFVHFAVFTTETQRAQRTGSKDYSFDAFSQCSHIEIDDQSFYQIHEFEIC